MTWEVFVSLIVAITGLITAIWTIIKFGIKRRDAQIKLNNELLGSVTARLDNIEKENERQSKLIDSNERDRLRQEIMAFGRELRAGHTKMTARDYEHICEVFDKYCKLGGNSYAHAEFEYILSCEQEFDKTQKGENK